MGKTYNKNQKRFDDEISGQRSGKTTKKGGGMKTLNKYVEEDYDDPFDDEVGMDDQIFIQHIQQDDTN